jgi:ABC-type multidrug transport system ATPase subunit
MTPPPPTASGDLAYEIRDLSWRLAPSFVLSVPRLGLRRGRTTAILGRSASGKSTLLSLLGRVEGGYFEGRPAASGAIHVHGLGAPGDSLELLSQRERALVKAGVRGRGIGFVFQREGLFPDRDALANVTWGLEGAGLDRREARTVAARALEDVSLDPDRQVATLSGGERKRLAIARAIALDPKVLLLDEPLTGLDPEALGALRALLGRLADGRRTLVMVTHQREDVIALADDLVFMDAGRVILSGARDTLGAELDRFFEGAIPSAPPTPEFPR